MGISKKLLAWLLAFVLIISICPMTTFGMDTYSDVSSRHWAYPQIEKWSSDTYGVLLGTGNGRFEPNKELTLAELVTILSKTFGYTERTMVTGLPEWADEHIEKAVAAGIILANEGDTVDLSAKVTREQAIKYIAVAYSIPSVDDETTFVDNSDIGMDYKGYVGAFQKLGYVIGKGQNTFDPQGYFTRAEALTIINNTTDEIIDKSVTGQTYTKSLIIRKSDVTVADTTIKSDLIIGQGVGDGNITLDNVILDGQLIVYGGGSNSIAIKGESGIPSTLVNKTSGEPVLLNGDFDTVVITKGSNAIATGTVKNLIILGEAEVTLDNSIVDNAKINGDNTKLTVNKKSIVDSITISANEVIIEGDGTVKEVIVTEKAKSGVEVLTVPTKITVDKNAGSVKTKNNGIIQPGSSLTTFNIPTSSSSSGKSSSKTSTISFDLNYTGAANPPERQTVSSGETAVKPTNPTREGFVFEGWYKEKSCENAFNFAEGITTNITLYAKWSQKIEDDCLYTRGEWIQILADALEFESNIIDTQYDYFYGDTENYEKGDLIETANALGLLPTPDSEGYEDPQQDIPLFRPDDTATREFVAYTVAKGMGFYGDYELACDDLEQLTYRPEVAVTVQQGFLSLKANQFNPGNALSTSDKNQILATIEEFNNSLSFEDSEMQDTVSLQEDVVVIASTDYSVTDKGDGTRTVTIEKNSETDQISVGSVFVLPANDDYIGGIALKATLVQHNGNNLTIDCVIPEMEEVISDFVFIGYGAADIANMTVADDVTAEYDPNGVIVADDEDQFAPFNIGGSTSLPGKLKYTLAEKSIGNTGVKVSGAFEVSIPDVTVKAKGGILGGFSLDELTVSVTNELKVSGSAEYSFGIPESSFDVTTGKPVPGRGKTELGRVPIALGTTGLTLDFVFFLNFEVGGTVTISYTITNTNGFQYKNKAFRTIKDYRTEFTAIELNASARLGLGLGVKLTLFSVWDLAGFDAHAGLGLTGKYVAHTDVDPTLHCLDGTVYLYATLELDEDTLVGWVLNKFNLSWSWDIYDEDNSVLKRKVHLENLRRTPDDKCTYGKGSLLGLVKDTGTNQPIKGARVELYNGKTNTLVKTLYTANTRTFEVLEGEFLARDLPAGTYKMKVMATGYQAYNQNVIIVKEQRSVCEASLMIQRGGGTNNGTVHGIITNALTGGRLEGVEYAIREGWSNTTDEPILSGTMDTTEYSFSLSPGNYTLEFSKEDFVTVYKNVAVLSDASTFAEIAITPTSGVEISDNSFRIVLTWGHLPYDLDSHLYGMNSSNNVVFHTWFAGKTYTQGGIRIADLDLDDVNSYGPETSTVYELDDTGSYSFYVHDYSNRNNYSSVAMANSGAQVKLYSGEALVATFNIPENRGGTLWHVFDYDASTGDVNFINSFSYCTLPGSTPPNAPQLLMTPLSDVDINDTEEMAAS